MKAADVNNTPRKNQIRWCFAPRRLNLSLALACGSASSNESAVRMKESAGADLSCPAASRGRDRLASSVCFRALKNLLKGRLGYPSGDGQTLGRQGLDVKESVGCPRRGIPHWCKSPAPGRCRPTVAACYGSDAASGSARSGGLPGSGRSTESGEATSPRCVSPLRPTAPVVLIGAELLRRRTADRRVRRDGALRLR
jgi:hypothetical protein